VDENKLKYILTDGEVKNLCQGCCETCEAIYINEGDERKERLQAELNELQSPTLKINNLIPFKLRKRDKETDKDTINV